MADDFMTRFQVLLAVPTSTIAQWRDLASDLQPTNFEAIVGLTEARNPTTDQSLGRAIQAFAVVAPAFRDFLAQYATDPSHLVPNSPTFAARIILNALVEAAKANAATPLPFVFQAFAAHRAYNETITIPTLPSTLGNDIRQQVQAQFALVAATSAFTFVAPLAFVLRETQKPLTPFAPNFDDRQFLLNVLHKLTDAATLSSLDWQAGLRLEMQPLTVLIDTLAFVYNDRYPYDITGQSEHFQAGDAILRAIERCAQIWSASYAGWDARPQISRVTPLRCLQTEAFLRGVLARLITRNLADNSKAGYLDGAGVSAYQDWITICGGYTQARADGFLSDGGATAEVPQPLWLRSWHSAEQLSLTIHLLPAVAPHTFVRWFDRLRIPDATPPSDRRDFPSITRAALVTEIGQEVWQATLAQHLAPSFDLNTGDPQTDPAPVNPPANAPTPGDPILHNALITRMVTMRSQIDAPLHPDHQRAMRIMSAAILQWRGEIAYRTAGPRAVIDGFTSSQAGNIRRASTLYQASLTLLGGTPPEGGADNDQFTIGLGLLGVLLDEERLALRDECRLRLKQIDLGNDWAAEQSEWPIQYLDSLNRLVESILSDIETLQRVGVDVPAQQEDRELEVQGRTLAVLQSQQLRDAAQDFLAAEQSTLDALLVDQKIADVRLQIAQFRAQEAKYLAAARQFAQDAQNNREQAEAALLTVEEEVSRQLDGQITLLKQNIQKLQDQLPGLQQQITAAGQTLEHFRQTAQQEHQSKQSQRAFLSIVKKIGSLVSIYFTGVDLVTIADTAIQAVKSAQNGDWAGAILHAKDAADLATGGKFSQALSRGLEDAERVIGSVMADSLNSAATTIEDKLGIPRTDALQNAIDAVSRQAFRIGVSYLANQTHTQAIADALGIPHPDPQVLTDLGAAAETELVDAAWQAFKRKGQPVVNELASVLSVGADAVEQTFRADIRAAAAAGEDVNQLIVGFVAKVQKNVPEADGVIAEIKAGFLDARDQLVAQISSRLQVETPRVRAALDDLTGKALAATAPQNLPLPPIVLPAEIAGAIRDFRLKVETAREKIGFLTEPGKADQLANQLAELDDDQFNQQLNQTVNQLQTVVQDASAAMQAAEIDLGHLQDKLAETEVARYQQAFKTQAQQFRKAEAASLQQSKGELVKAAGEATVAAEQQIQVEQFAQQVAGSRVAAQSSVVDARKSELAAAETEIDIRQIGQRKAENERARWERLNVPENVDNARNLAIASLWYLEEASRLLVQSFQMLTLYEVDLLGLARNSNLQPTTDPTNPANFTPDFLTPTADHIKAGKALMDLAQQEWNLKLLEPPRLLTTIRLADIGGGLSNPVKDKLLPFFTAVEGDLFPSLLLSGTDLKRLKNGLTFRIRPFFNARFPLPVDYPAFAPLEVYTDTVTVPPPAPVAGLPNQPGEARRGRAGLVVDLNAVPGWLDEGAFRIRLLGVLLKVTNRGGAQQPIHFYMRQEADCGIVVRDDTTPLKRRYVPVPLPPVQDEDVNGRGVQLVSGPIITPQWETRPLFGTYTVTIDDIVDIPNPDQFAAEIHFVALGQPR